MPAPCPLLFDFDGTLIDSAPDIRTAANRMLAERDLAPLTLTQIHGFVGDGAPALVERCLRAAGAPMGTVGDEQALARLTARYMALYQAIRPDPSCIYPGVVSTLATLRDRGHPMALVTNKPEAATHAVLDATGLAPFFPVVVGGDTLPRRKPDPAPVREALRRLATPTPGGRMVGDSVNDVRAGRGAGLRVVVAAYGYTHGPVADLGADDVITHFPDLLALV